MKIWKHYVSWHEINGVVQAQMPYGAEILSCGVQGDGVAVWFKCDPEQPMITRPLTIVGTGHNCPSTLRFIGTVQHPETVSPLVMHLFDGQELRP